MHVYQIANTYLIQLRNGSSGYGVKDTVFPFLSLVSVSSLRELDFGSSSAASGVDPVPGETAQEGGGEGGERERCV